MNPLIFKINLCLLRPIDLNFVSLIHPNLISLYFKFSDGPLTLIALLNKPDDQISCEATGQTWEMPWSPTISEAFEVSGLRLQQLASDS